MKKQLMSLAALACIAAAADYPIARQRIDPYATDRRYWALDWRDLK